MVKILAESGVTLSFSLTAKDENRDPVDLTGYTAYGTVRPYAGSETVTLDLAPTIPTPTDGVIEISISAANTANVTPDSYVWEVVVDTPTGDSIKLADGPMIFRHRVAAGA